MTTLRARLARISPQHWTFAAPVVVAVVISAVFTARGASANPETRRFSGSHVVMKMPSLLAPARLPAPTVVAIVRDHEAANFYDSPRVLDSIVASWRRVLEPTGARVRVVAPSQIRGAGARVLVVPSSPCLSLTTREAIDMAGARGQGLIVSGPVGTHDAGCREIGYGLVVRVSGAPRLAPLTGRPMVYATLRGGSPLATDIPPGARLNISPGSQLALRTAASDGFYSEYTLGRDPAGGEPHLDGAVVRSTYRGARVVYLGFELRDVVDNDWHRGVLRLLARNAVAWTAGLALAAVDPWPRGHAWSAVIAQDVEAQYANARFPLDSLVAARVRSTFFVTSNSAGRYDDLTRAMAENGEVATHSENHKLLGGAPFERQLARLALTRRDLRELLDGEVLGLRPPEEQFDQATMEAWLAAGGTYLLGANDSRTAGPELLRLKKDTLVLLPRAFADDFTAAGPEHRRSPDLVTSIFRADIQRARHVNGLYVLSYHSQVLARPEYVSVLATMARELKADTGVWLTTAGEVAEWWRRRSFLRVETVRTTSDYVELLVRNRGDSAVANVVVSVMLPPGRTVSAAPNVVVRDGMARVSVSRIAAQGRRVVRVGIV